jgi:hypothetical protein
MTEVAGKYLVYIWRFFILSRCHKNVTFAPLFTVSTAENPYPVREMEHPYAL